MYTLVNVYQLVADKRGYYIMVVQITSKYQLLNSTKQNLKKQTLTLNPSIHITLLQLMILLWFIFSVKKIKKVTTEK